MKQLYILSIFCFLFAGLYVDASAQIPSECPNGEYKIIRDDGSIYCSPTICPGQIPFILEDGIYYCGPKVICNGNGANGENPCLQAPCPDNTAVIFWSCQENPNHPCGYECVPMNQGGCGPGTEGLAIGSTALCLPCEKGTSSYPLWESGGSFKCFPCQEGMFQDEEEQANCKSCPEGTYQDEKGAEICKSCPEG